MAHRCPSCTSPATRIAAGLWTCRRHGPLPAAKSGPQSDEMAEALKRHAPALGINTQ